MYNLNNDYKDESKHIISKRWFHSQYDNVSFREFNTKEGKNLIKRTASFIYNRVLDSEDNKFSSVVDRENTSISRVNYYSVTYDNIVALPNGNLVNETGTALEYDYVINPEYVSGLTKELNKLAKKDNLYLDISFTESKEFDCFIVTVSSLTKEQFESIYGMSLEEYYDAVNKKFEKGNTHGETQFRKAVAKLKKSYILCMIEDIKKDFNKSDVEIDGYISYLQLICGFEKIPNKEEILREFGFEIDSENSSLIFIPNKEKTLELK